MSLFPPLVSLALGGRDPRTRGGCAAAIGAGRGGPAPSCRAARTSVVSSRSGHGLQGDCRKATAPRHGASSTGQILPLLRRCGRRLPAHRELPCTVLPGDAQSVGSSPLRAWHLAADAPAPRSHRIVPVSLPCVWLLAARGGLGIWRRRRLRVVPGVWGSCCQTLRRCKVAGLRWRHLASMTPGRSCCHLPPLLPSPARPHSGLRGVRRCRKCPLGCWARRCHASLLRGHPQTGRASAPSASSLALRGLLMMLVGAPAPGGSESGHPGLWVPQLNLIYCFLGFILLRFHLSLRLCSCLITCECNS